MHNTEQWIRLQTEIPGPNARALLERRIASVPQGVANTSQTFVAQAQGALITDVDGNTLIDFAGAIGTLNAGHCPPQVVEALKAQLDRYIHPCFHVVMYEPYIQLAETLNRITPGGHAKKTYFLNSGAEAVENAVKIARKYTGRRAVVSFDRGFHGRTFMAMSLTSKVKPYKFGFGPFAPDTYKLPYPITTVLRRGARLKRRMRDCCGKSKIFFLPTCQPKISRRLLWSRCREKAGSSSLRGGSFKVSNGFARRTAFSLLPMKCKPVLAARAGCSGSSISMLFPI